MKLFVCTLLVTMFVVAMLTDDAEGVLNFKEFKVTRRRRMRTRLGLHGKNAKLANPVLKEVGEEAESLLDLLNELPEQLDAREEQDLEEEGYAQKRR